MPTVVPGLVSVSIVAPASRLATDANVRSGSSFAKPKSNTFACPSGVTKMFAGLMSR